MKAPPSMSVTKSRKALHITAVGMTPAELIERLIQWQFVVVAWSGVVSVVKHVPENTFWVAWGEPEALHSIIKTHAHGLDSNVNVVPGLAKTRAEGTPEDAADLLAQWTRTIDVQCAGLAGVVINVARKK